MVYCKKKMVLGLAVVILSAVFLPRAAIGQSYLPKFGDSRAGTSGFQFLKIGVDARSAAMGGSVVADANDASSLFWNPALAAQAQSNQVFLGHTQYFDDISMNFAGYIHRLDGMAFGVSLQFLDSGEIEETDEFNQFGTGRTFRTNHMAVGLSFAQELSSVFSYGVTLKYLDERIENVVSRTGVVDFGLFYRVGETRLRFAVGLNNFGFGATPSGETTRETLNGKVVEDEFADVNPPTRFIIGVAYSIMDNEQYNWMMTSQLTNPSDNAERVSMGTEFTWMNRFSVRTGYEVGVNEALFPSFGIGVQLPMLSHRVHIDYGFAPRERLGNFHRFAFRFEI